MRIEIITQPLGTNYGGILQNFALQKVLRSMGHETLTVDYHKYSYSVWIRKCCRSAVRRLVGRQVTFPPMPSRVRRNETPLRRFVEKYIKLTTPRTWKIKGGVVKKYAPDALVVGSDQVWRTLYNNPIERCFLDFSSGWNVKRIAYAASFGTEDWQFTEKQTLRCGTLAKKFDGISVREDSGEELCRKHLGVEAVRVLDPTLLLRVEDYVSLCRDIPEQDPFVFAYILDKSPEKLEGIKAFAEKRGLRFLIKSAGRDVKEGDSVEAWLSCFRDAAFIITDSFHGAAFSIIFNKPFYVFSNALRGNGRFKTLLKLFDLEDRLTDSLQDCGREILWEEVERRKREEMEISLQWLENQLDGKQICQK